MVPTIFTVETNISSGALIEFAAWRAHESPLASVPDPRLFSGVQRDRARRQHLATCDFKATNLTDFVRRRVQEQLVRQCIQVWKTLHKILFE